MSSADMEFEDSENRQSAGTASQIQITQEQVMNKLKGGIGSMFAGFQTLKAKAKATAPSKDVAYEKAQ